ncbi:MULTISPECIES: SDR family oxidoreductase [Rhodococcus]|uniref:Short chain dehydrogenase n=1 Tax=Rhodococcus opacus TaxID=37919 RepID=A0A1B1KED1_RHOOP|nr:SDR family oxidoreductase [Rhodococcus opacus]ELB85671.1 short chain dehydrogenase [Rhodococcus wratislaviensis IFP 2016]NHU43693.1 SDR family oxidoreductase [Rhodococcus sp. A14]ANS30948.1 short chain dehydrogenase [Rhodococcus opacus]MBA8961755.1 NAD(P)-dependent dehydrogenase (short-subunit alcohol dehydrogenase family) [Rhodococcus opacus]MBP2202381.1 NAD(P)-dependent dehydrogenase (short-subunit alcohol dehydrogenase family) [Rhodococcus opacus]
MPTLRNKVALVTGAARGIGAETSRALARKGVKLVLIDLDAEPLKALAAELGDDVALAAAADVCDLAAVQKAVDAGVAKFGGIDLVLANAGIASYGSVMHVDPATFKRVIDINILGVFHTVRAALPSVIDRKGYILVVSSLAAFAPAPGLAAYNTSKAGIEHFANTLRLEVAHHGVTVGSAHMSWIDTPLVQDAKADLTAFNQLLAVLPGPLGKTTSVDSCVDAFVDGLAGRKRRVYVPRWVELVGWLKAVVTSPIGDRSLLPHVPRILPLMDEEVAKLGRSTSARNVALGDVAVDPK